MNNRIWNATNPNQMSFRRTLCVCSAGLLRSPTAALVLAAAPFNCNTRAVGIEESYALIAIDDVLVHWAEDIVCMTEEHKAMLISKFSKQIESKILVLDIPDIYSYRHPVLMRLIADSYTKLKASHDSNTNNT